MLLLFLFVIGLSIGSFLNVLIDRLPKGEKLTGRSYCDHCKKKIAAFDLIPVLSYLYLRGKCRFCGRKIDVRYPFVELLTGALFVLTFLYIPADSLIVKLLFLGVISSLIVIFFADLRYQIIPDRIQLSFFIFSAAILLYQGVSLSDGLIRLVRGVLISSPLLAIYFFTKGKGMGFADIKYAVIMGFLLGYKAGFLAVYLSFILGSIWGLILIALKLKKFRSKVAFGPFLVLGTVISLFFFPQIYNFLLTFLPLT